MFSQLFATTWFLVILFVVGLTILVKGADWLVDGASDLAKRLGVLSEMHIYTKFDLAAKLRISKVRQGFRSLLCCA